MSEFGPGHAPSPGDRPSPPGHQRGWVYTPRRTPVANGAPPWKIWEALLVVALFSLSQPISSLAASFLLSSGLPVHLSVREAEDEMFKVVLPLVIVISHGLGWLCVAWLVVYRHGLPLLRGLKLHGLRRFRFGRIFLAGMGLQVVGVLMAALMPPPEELDNPMLRFVAFGRWAVALLFLMAVVMAPFLEEVLFRGILFPALRRRLRFVPAALLVTVLFAGLHAVQTSGYWPALIAIAITGFLLAWLRESSDSLWPPVIFHMGFNFTALLPILLLGGQLPEGMPGMF